jgi:hypothetical protein
MTTSARPSATTCARQRRRPIVLVGVEQGGILAARLLNEEIAPNPAAA